MSVISQNTYLIRAFHTVLRGKTDLSLAINVAADNFVHLLLNIEQHQAFPSPLITSGCKRVAV